MVKATCGNVVISHKTFIGMLCKVRRYMTEYALIQLVDDWSEKFYDTHNVLVYTFNNKVVIWDISKE